jgi:hypothetical protein
MPSPGDRPDNTLNDFARTLRDTGSGSTTAELAPGIQQQVRLKEVASDALLIDLGLDEPC